MQPLYKAILSGLLFLFGMGSASPLLNVSVQPGDYMLTPITNHTPDSSRNVDEYWDRLQKVELSLGGQEKWKDLPALNLKQPYTGAIKLGDKPQECGVVVDIVDGQKRIYIDSDGDGSFAGEAWHPLLDEWQGLQIYWVQSPEPIPLQVNYKSGDHPAPLEIMVWGLLNKPGPFLEEKPYLRVYVRTWFYTEVKTDHGSTIMAIVDRNHNGNFNDASDELFVDQNDNGYFEEKENVPRKKGVIIKSGDTKLKCDWEVHPEKLMIGVQ